MSMGLMLLGLMSFVILSVYRRRYTYSKPNDITPNVITPNDTILNDTIPNDTILNDISPNVT